MQESNNVREFTYEMSYELADSARVKNVPNCERR